MTPKYPKINPDRDRDFRFYLCEDVTVTLTDGTEYTIPEGFRFDGHSVPFIFRSFFPVFDLDVYAALVHDYLIDTRMMKGHRYSRQFIDEQYEHFMNQPEYLATPLRRWLFPRAVNLWRKIML